MFTLYSADFIGNPGNCSYPHKFVVMDADSLKAAVVDGKADAGKRLQHIGGLDPIRRIF